jgi:hypothetical protein
MARRKAAPTDTTELDEEGRPVGGTAAGAAPRDPGPPPPERDENGVLTRKGMRDVIRRGGTVVHQGQHIHRVEDIPEELTVVRAAAEPGEVVKADAGPTGEEEEDDKDGGDKPPAE